MVVKRAAEEYHCTFLKCGMELYEDNSTHRFPSKTKQDLLVVLFDIH